jgi:hypothetical protein
MAQHASTVIFWDNRVQNRTKAEPQAENQQVNGDSRNGDSLRYIRFGEKLLLRR